MCKHNQRLTVNESETPDFISPELWPQQSGSKPRRLYTIWGVMQQRVYEMQIHNVDELKQRLVDAWSGL